jgi:hypothetical protein
MNSHDLRLQNSLPQSLIIRIKKLYQLTDKQFYDIKLFKINCSSLIKFEKICEWQKV